MNKLGLLTGFIFSYRITEHREESIDMIAEHPEEVEWLMAVTECEEFMIMIELCSTITQETDKMFAKAICDQEQA